VKRAPLVVVLMLVVALPAAARKPRPSRSNAPSSVPAAELMGPFQYQFSQAERVDVASGRTQVSAVSRTHVPWMGWFPLRVTIDNSVGPTQTVTLAYRSSVGEGGSAITRAVDVEAGERRHLSFPVPAELRYGVLEASSPVIGRERATVGFASIGGTQRLVMTLGAPEQFEIAVGKPPDNTSGEDQVLVLPLDEAPVELAAYVGLHAVMVTDPRGFDGLSEPQRQALEAWTASGGTLVLASLPRTKGVLPLLTSEDALQPYGLGHLALMAGPGWSISSLPVARLPVSPLGQIAGREYVPDGTAGYPALLPQAMVPVARFLVIITLFTLLIGPGSVWLARRRGSAVLLATIPATAFVTCASILGSSLLVDGFTVHASSFGYTLLDPERSRAITLGLTAWYANLAPNEAQFDGTTALIAPTRSGSATAADLDWRDGARFGSGFIPSRAYREWGLVSVSATRARLVLKQQGDRVLLQNALGMQLESAWVRVGEETWLVKGLPDGGEVALSETDRLELAALAIEGSARFAAEVWKPLMMAPLQDGDFIAKVDGEGFVSTGGIRVSLHQGQHVVRGTVTR